MPPVITGAKLAVEICLPGDQLVDAGQILIAQRPQAVSNISCIGNFRPNEPERVNERKTNKPGPLFAQVPKTKFVCVLLPKPDRLIADEQPRRVRCTN